MTSPWIRLAGVGGLLLALLMPAAGADKKQQPPPPAIAKLAWLAGRWRLERNGRLIESQWMAPAGGVMLGMSRTVAKARAVDHEFLQIREGPGGALFYVAQTAGQKEAAYQNSALSETAAVFENPEQDFPQKISFTLQPDGSLLMALDGPGPDGEAKRIERPYQKVP